MRAFSKVLFASVLALSAAAPVLADDPAAPPSDFTISGGAAVTSDYRFRGISQTDKRFAVQGTFTISHASGFYASVWGSSIDDYVANGGDQEIDLIGGYKKTISGTTIDGGMLYYYYPGSHGANTDFFEPYLNVSHTLGPISGKLGLNYSWKQHALSCSLCSSSREDNLYTYGEAAFAVPKTGITITGHLGETWGRSYLSDGLKNYTDWSVTAAYTWKALTFSAAYVDTDIKQAEGDVGTGRSPVKAGFVGAVAVAF